MPSRKNIAPFVDYGDGSELYLATIEEFGSVTHAVFAVDERAATWSGAQSCD
jgi:hypothetical protein